MVNKDCVFCKIVAERTSSYRYSVIIEPLNPVVPGHRIAISNRHVTSAAAAPWIAGMTFRDASEFGDEWYESFNLITSIGEAATQSIRHLHVHIVPRYQEDGLKLPWTDQIAHSTAEQ